MKENFSDLISEIETFKKNTAQDELFKIFKVKIEDRIRKLFKDDKITLGNFYNINFVPQKRPSSNIERIRWGIIRQEAFIKGLNALEQFLNYLNERIDNSDYPSSVANQELQDNWIFIHPRVTSIAKSRMESGHFADAVEAAIKEINTIVKNHVKQLTGNEYDGSNLMERAFSIGNPLITLDDLSTETGKNIQKGYLQIFSGTMTGIRNPKAHENIVISKERAFHLIFLASLLMYKLEDCGVI